VNAAIDLVRRRRPETPVVDQVARTSEEKRIEDVDLLRRALATVSPLDREILLARELEGIGDEAIAERLGLTVTSVRVRVHRARKKLRAAPDTLACDALLDQDIFAGVGNIIKNEVLFRIRVHPLSTMGALPPAKLRALVQEARQYSFDFLEWKKAFTLKQHWLAHNQKTCPRCHIPFNKANLGRTNRRSFWCERCQKRYG